MSAPVIIPIDKSHYSRLAFSHALVALDVDVLVLECLPEPLDVDIVKRSALAVHGEFRRAAILLEQTRKLVRSILTALVGVEHLRPSVLAHGFLQDFDAEIR